jgi:hypothetical protein
LLEKFVLIDNSLLSRKRFQKVSAFAVES